SWFAGASGLNLVSDAIAAASSFLDSGGNSSEYAVGIHDGSSLRVYDGAKCAQISLYQSAPSGPILMDMRWVCIYGDSEKGAATVPSTSCTLKISTGGGAGTGIQLVLSLSKDAKEEDVKPALLYQTNDYALFSATGAYPVVLSTF